MPVFVLFPFFIDICGTLQVHALMRLDAVSYGRFVEELEKIFDLIFGIVCK